MPVPANLSSMLQRALSNRILSESEARKIAIEVEKGGVTPEEVRTVVEALTEGVKDGLELDTATRRRNLDAFLARLDRGSPTGLGAQAPGGMSFVDALVLRAGGQLPEVPGGPGVPGGVPGEVPAQPTHPVDQTTLPAKSFGGQTLEVHDDGALCLDGTVVPLPIGSPSAEHLGALAGLLPPGQLDALDDGQKSALAAKLVAQLEATLPIAPGEGAYKKTAAAAFALGALAKMPGVIAGDLTDRLLALYDKAPNPMTQALLYTALQGASVDDTQAAKRHALSAPAHKDALLSSWNQMAAGQARFGWQTVKGPVQEVALAGLAFCKEPSGVEALYQGFAPYGEINPGSGFDAEEATALGRVLEGYVEKHGALGYVFGTFEADAPKEIARITNARVAAAITPKLESETPRLHDVPLTKAQADFVKTLVPGLKDERAAQSLAEALKEAAQLTSPYARGWGSVPAPSEPLSPAAFALFSRIASAHLENRDGTPDGMMDARALVSDVKREVTGIREELQPRLAELAKTPPGWKGIEVSVETASLLRQTIANHLRSSMSVTNLGLALEVVAQKHGGKVTGEGAQQFARVLDEYMANWPDLQTFDFNKLERIARFTVEGKAVPLCTLNGQPVGLAEFYTKVGQAVTDSIDRGQIRHEWQAHRWGFRAAESAELLDVIAELSARGEGPLAALKARYPGREIEVRATGLDGVHQQFLFVVKDGYQELFFSQGHDGTVAPYRDRKDPVLFTAKVQDDGSLDVVVPAHNRVRKYPLQTTYGVGDSIDLKIYDPQAREVREEGKTFETKYRVVEGKITGFDAAGNYTVAYKKPDGSDAVETMSLTKIMQANHPHYFSETGSYLRDVEIDIRDDQPLKDFLDGAGPIIQRHLPTDGSLAGLSAAELAKRQRACVEELMAYTAERMIYPGSENSTNENDQRYYQLDGLYRFDLGELVKIQRGVCRHMCIAFHLLLQRAGIDSRLASGAANTSAGAYRGLHLWVELGLADNSRYLSDQTWGDPLIPLWQGAYDVDKRRLEIYDRTSDFDRYHVA